MPANRVLSEVDLKEAAEHVAVTGEVEGPHTITDRAEALYDGIVPQPPYEADFLAGRICLNAHEMEAALGVGRKALEAMVRRGELPSVRIGNRRLFPIKAVENHLTALSYAESGALDAWEAALIRGTAARIRTTRRRAWERRKYLRKKLKRARREGVNVNDTLGRDYFTLIRAEVAELVREQVISDRVAKDLLVDLDRAAHVYGLNLEDIEDQPGMGLPDDQRAGGQAAADAARARAELAADDEG